MLVCAATRLHCVKETLGNKVSINLYYFITGFLKLILKLKFYCMQSVNIVKVFQLFNSPNLTSQILNDAERTPLKDSSRSLTYDLLCAMANPSRADTRGLSQLAEVAERFAFSLLTDIECEAEGKR